MIKLLTLVLVVNAGAAAAETPDVELLDFTASYCQPCQQMVPVLQKMERDQFPIRKIDITEEHELARQFKVDLIPTLVLMVEGKEVKRFVGLTDEAELRREMNRAARQLAESRGAVPRSQEQMVAALPAAAKTEPDKSVDAATPEDSRSSVKDIFRGLLGGGARPTAFEYPTLRAQSPDESAEVPAGLDAAFAATVRVRVEGVSTKNGTRVQDVGTGTIVYSAPGQAIILTCAHVFMDLSTKDALIEIEVFENGKAVPYKASLIGGDHNSDLAFLKLQTSKIMPVIRLTESAPKVAVGQGLVSFGCNGGSDPTPLETKVADIDRYNGPKNLVCTTDPKSGRSGGGLFSKEGELVGVCSCADRKLHEGLYMAHAPILALVKQLNMTSILTTPAGSVGEDAASSFAALLEGKSDPAEKTPAPIETRSEGIAGIEAPEFDESAEPELEEPQPVDVAMNETGELSDAPLFNPRSGDAKASQAADAVAVSASGQGPEITIVIDDKTPGSQKKVIVIHQASPYIMELLTGESTESAPSTTRSMARPATATTSSRKSAAATKRTADFRSTTLAQ